MQRHSNRADVAPSSGASLHRPGKFANTLPNNLRDEVVAPASTDTSVQPQRGAGRIIRMKELIHRLGVGKTTVYAAIARGELPPSIRLTSGCVGFLESEIDAYIAARAAARGAA